MGSPRSLTPTLFPRHPYPQGVVASTPLPLVPSGLEPLRKPLWLPYGGEGMPYVLRLYNPASEAWLLTPEEADKARQAAEARAREAEARVAEVEAELERLRAQLAGR